jgi:hypothetical protein
MAVCSAACAADERRVPARGHVAGTSIETTVDSELARYFLERDAPGTAPRPDVDAIIERARAELRGPSGADTIKRIAREASPDLAALLLAEALLVDDRSAALRRLYREELHGAARGGPAALDTSRFTLLFAPGWLYRSHPENGAGFERQLALAAEMGLDAERIDTEENATVEQNARVIAEDLRHRAGSGRRYVVVSASKSGPEVALALAMLSPGEAGQVAAWVNVAGVLGGSALADGALVAPRCWAALALFGWRRGGLDGMRSMSTSARRGALSALRIPEHVIVVNDVPLPLSGQVSRRARGGYEGMRSLGPNDGLALTLDEIFPGAATLVELGLDHYMSAPDIDRRTVALTRAVLRLVAHPSSPCSDPARRSESDVRGADVQAARGGAAGAAEHSNCARQLSIERRDRSGRRD